MSADLTYVQTILLRRDPADPASHLDSIAAAATASVLAYLYDLEAGWDLENWNNWHRDGQAKTTRRAKPSVFERLSAEAVSEFWVGKAAAAAFSPVPPSAVPAAVSRLQVSGTELPRTAAAGPEGACGAIIVLNGSLGMSTGKSCAQAAHALLEWVRNGARREFDMPAVSRRIRQWAKEGYGVRIHEAGAEEFIRLQGGRTPHSLIHDHGHTEIAPGTATAFVLGF